MQNAVLGSFSTKKIEKNINDINLISDTVFGKIKINTFMNRRFNAKNTYIQT